MTFVDKFLEIFSDISAAPKASAASEPPSLTQLQGPDIDPTVRAGWEELRRTLIATDTPALRQ